MSDHRECDGPALHEGGRHGLLEHDPCLAQLRGGAHHANRKDAHDETLIIRGRLEFGDEPRAWSLSFAPIAQT
ncbi:MAG: hypothetical protein U9R79_11495 [Armatimonadota bacterium]|nr:hypothetical protein [Armatimonadota bacterium]